jgi:hypothetical protein
MANLTHTNERPGVLAKEFDIVFVPEETLARISTTYKSPTSVAASSSNSIFEQESLQQFHEEFKQLVLASNQVLCSNEEMAWDDAQPPIEPHEIKWLDW